ncbi:type II secretion system F family protein [Candidatus Uhrbacteria bacterium]|nr:type II secretion system F family protein [Candidatus Uhrbacteria bacterium]
MQSARRTYHALGNIFHRTRIGLSLRDCLLFTEKLSYLINAHQPLATSLRILRRHERPPISTFLDRVLCDVENGTRLSAAMEHACTSFSPFAITMIHVGEACGMLGKNLASVADDLKKKSALRSAIANALTYPTLIAVAIVCVASLLAFYLFPKILPIIQSLRLDLPLSTRLLIDAHQFFKTFSLLILVGSGIAGGLTVWALRKEFVRIRVDELLITLPLIRQFVVCYESAVMCRTLGLLLASDVRLSDGLDICRETTRNRCYALAFGDIKKNVLSGSALSVHLERYPRLFPAMMREMAAVGEESGNVSSILLSLANHYESRMEEHAKRFAAMLEPVLMLALGLIIGFIATAIITPFYAITAQLQRF